MKHEDVCVLLLENNPAQYALRSAYLEKIITSWDTVMDRVTGLELGADNYICKPYPPCISTDAWDDIIHQLKGIAGNYRLMKLYRVVADQAICDEDQLTKLMKEAIDRLKKSF